MTDLQVDQPLYQGLWKCTGPNDVGTVSFFARRPYIANVWSYEDDTLLYGMFFRNAIFSLNWNSCPKMEQEDQEFHIVSKICEE